MLSKNFCSQFAWVALSSSMALMTQAEPSEKRQTALEEVLVTAQKREEDLQSAPIAISVLNRAELQAQGIANMADLKSGTIPSLRVMSAGIPSSTLILSIRGNGSIDMNPVTRETQVGFYRDGFFIARPQGLDVDVPDLERIEVLRGPQGTLFGRNTMAGAVNFITRKPTGKFGFEQTAGLSNYDGWKTVTRLNLPEYADVSTKIDYIHAQRDGWVKNDAPGQWNYNAYQNDGGRFSLRFTPTDDLIFDYAYDNSRSLGSGAYYQIYRDDGVLFPGFTAPLPLVGDEPDRASNTRAPVPLRPTYVYQKAHSLTAAWSPSENFTLKSLTGYYALTENGYTSYGASIYNNGSIDTTDSKESQFSQELQLIGSFDSTQWVAGWYYFKNRAHQMTRLRFALDTFGVLPGNMGKFNTPIYPPADLGVPDRFVTANTHSNAFYGQATTTPPILDDRLHITVGLRYTRDKKDGYRIELGYVPYDLNTNHWDSAVTLDYSWTDKLSTYLKRATGYRSGSVNPRSESFAPYDPDKVTSWELGIKSEFAEQKVRLNADVFENKFENMQIDVSAPTIQNITNTETINAEKDIRIRGAELELSVVPAEGLILGLNYTYLDGHMPLQPNKFSNGAIQEFELTQTPRNASSFTADYTFSPWSFGTLKAHMDAAYTSGYARQAQDSRRQQSVTLINARLTLDEIPLDNFGALALSIWGKNLTNYEYAEFAFPLSTIAVVQSFGEPRTFGFDLTYRY